MDTIPELFKINFSSFITSIFLILSAIIAIFTIIGRFSEIIGKPVVWIRKKNEDHTLTLQNTEAIKELSKQLVSLTAAQREILADKINQKYKLYISIKGIPEDEVDEFTNLHIAYKGCGGNHSGDAKYEYCINHLPVIPVETKLITNKEK